VCRPVTFKNTGTVAFAYEWNVLQESEGSDPPPVSSVAELIGNNARKGILPREHYLSTERSSIFCMKSKGVILPGEIVRTLFSFSSRGAGGVVCGVWALSTVPTANIAIDPEGGHGADLSSHHAVSHLVPFPSSYRILSYPVSLPCPIKSHSTHPLSYSTYTLTPNPSLLTPSCSPHPYSSAERGVRTVELKFQAFHGRYPSPKAPLRAECYGQHVSATATGA
jgi:hypothetical protein